jgi:antitoxin ParD1/3/4
MAIFDNFPELRYGQIMTLNVSLTPNLEAFVHQTVSTGRYQSASEVVRTALRLLQDREQQKAAMLDWLALEVQKGLDSGPAEPITPAFWKALRNKVLQSQQAAGGNDSAN